MNAYLRGQGNLSARATIHIGWDDSESRAAGGRAKRPVPTNLWTMP
jgi:hypothetical protein